MYEEPKKISKRDLVVFGIVLPVIKRTIRDILVNTIDQIMYANCGPRSYYRDPRIQCKSYSEWRRENDI
jgi:hypothetical protein